VGVGRECDRGILLVTVDKYQKSFFILSRSGTTSPGSNPAFRNGQEQLVAWAYNQDDRKQYGWPENPGPVLTAPSLAFVIAIALCLIVFALAP